MIDFVSLTDSQNANDHLNSNYDSIFVKNAKEFVK